MGLQAVKFLEVVAHLIPGRIEVVGVQHMVVAVESVRAVGRRAVMVLLQLMKPISVNARPKVKSLPNLYVAPRSNATPYPGREREKLSRLTPSTSVAPSSPTFVFQLAFFTLRYATFRAGSPLVVAEVGFGVAKVYVGTAYSDEQLNRSTHGETLHKLIEAVGVLEREFGICVGSGVDIADSVHPPPPRLETPSFTKRTDRVAHAPAHCHCVEAHVVVAAKGTESDAHYAFARRSTYAVVGLDVVHCLGSAHIGMQESYGLAVSVVDEVLSPTLPFTPTFRLPSPGTRSPPCGPRSWQG